MIQEDNEHGDDDERPSKSLRKRQSHDLQALGEALIALPQAELDALPLPEVLRDAVILARRITQHGGLYRQKQYIGKLMRKIDAEPIRDAIEARREQERVATRLLHLIERWRIRLIDSTDGTLDEFMQSYPAADRALLMRLIARAQQERSGQHPPKTTRATRELFGAVEKAVKRSGE